MFAAWGSKSDKTSTEKGEVESAKKRRMENKRCMERRFISFDKVEYIMIYMCIVVSIDNINVQQENKRQKCPPRANQDKNHEETKNQATKEVKRHQKTMFIQISDMIIFFSLMSIHITHHTYNIALKKKQFEFFFL